MKMWILNGEQITDTKAHVQAQYSQVAFDELVTLGHPIANRLVQVEMPEYDYLNENMVGNLYTNPQDNSVWYEYTVRPLTAEEIREQRLSNLELAMAELLGM